ncbi:MAG: hypothetical protein ACLTG4_03205 [Oscillospiraceae bacterium]
MKTKLTEMFGIEYPIVQSGISGWPCRSSRPPCARRRYRHHQRHLLADARRRFADALDG